MSRQRHEINLPDLAQRLGLTEAQLLATLEGKPQAAPGGTFHPGSIPEDMVLIEREQWDALQQERQIAASRERNQLIDEAISRGKFAPHRRGHYTTLYDSDPQGTTRLIVGMADSVVPVEARGNGLTDEFASDDAYPQHWLPDVHAAARGPVMVARD